MQFVSLFSGSSGNSAYVGSNNTHLLVDVGVSNKRIEGELNRLELKGKDINGVFLTHEHSDHIQGLEVFVRKNQVPVYASRGTLEALRESRKFDRILEFFCPITPGQQVEVGDLCVYSFSIDHDAREPLGFRIEGEKKIGVATDLGQFTPEIVRELSGLDALLVEANHDVRMLETGPYPYSLKRRILSKKGHLSNENAGRLICSILHEKIKKIFLGHLSAENNLPQLALESVRCEIFEMGGGFSPDDFDIEVAKREGLSSLCRL